jgi:hypothetical protein
MIFQKICFAVPLALSLSHTYKTASILATTGKSGVSGENFRSFAAEVAKPRPNLISNSFQTRATRHKGLSTGGGYHMKEESK